MSGTLVNYLEKPQKYRVLYTWMWYRTHKVSGTVENVNSREVSGICKEIVQNSHKCWVSAICLNCLREATEVPGMVNTREAGKYPRVRS